MYVRVTQLSKRGTLICLHDYSLKIWESVTIMIQFLVDLNLLNIVFYNGDCIGAFLKLLCSLVGLRVNITHARSMTTWCNIYCSILKIWFVVVTWIIFMSLRSFRSAPWQVLLSVWWIFVVLHNIYGFFVFNIYDLFMFKFRTVQQSV